MIYETDCSAENTNGNCCGLSHKCDENQGDCDSDSDCKDGLKCGDDNCPGFPNSLYDCCTCFETGKYIAWKSGTNIYQIDIVNSINDAESCQNLCQEHSQCKFWTWNKIEKHCKRHTGISPGTCGEDCKRGPRSCPGKSLNIYTYCMFCNKIFWRINK